MSRNRAEGGGAELEGGKTISPAPLIKTWNQHGNLNICVPFEGGVDEYV